MSVAFDQDGFITNLLKMFSNVRHERMKVPDCGSNKDVKFQHPSRYKKLKPVLHTTLARFQNHCLAATLTKVSRGRRYCLYMCSIRSSIKSFSAVPASNRTTSLYILRPFRAAQVNFVYRGSRVNGICEDKV